MIESMLFLTDAELEKSMTMAEAVDLAEVGVRAEGVGQVAGDKFYMAVGDEGFIKPFSGYLAGSRGMALS